MPWTEKHARSLEATLKRMRERGPPGKLYNNDLNSEPEQSSEEEETDAESDGHISIESTTSEPGQNIEHIVENNRRYCNETYHMPNDEAEQTRLNIIHQIYLILFDGKLATVSIPNDSPRILDLGTGPGDWAIEMSELDPDATIIASDISIFDTRICHMDIPNVFFQLCDASAEWEYHEPFDFIHIRGLSGAFRDWSHIYNQAFKHLKPGGYIEVSDADPAGDTVEVDNSDNSYLSIYTSAMRSAADAAGYPRDLSHLRRTLLSDSGFVDIRTYERQVPIGLWPDDLQGKTLGKMALIALLEGLEAYSLRPLTTISNWTADEVRDLCGKVKGELITSSKITGRVRTLTGKKPESAGVKSDVEMTF